jgi:two-component system phosphate regulon sensor histidine kinase PhoR
LLARDGVAPGVLFVFYDVTRIRQLEAVRRDFVANVSHELRTPVTSIKGFVETLIDGAKDEPDSLDRFLAIIARQAERLNSIFNDLLTLARLEAGGDGAKIDLESRGILDLVQAAVDDCSHRGEAKGMRLEVRIDADVKVRVNPSLIQQALVNLIDNAIKYSDNNRIVCVEARLEGTFVQVAVVDQGPGIEAAHLARVFERFYRIDQGRSRQLGGTGLGLAIVKHIAHVHGGDVSVESEVGRGSRFSISLPAERE